MYVTDYATDSGTDYYDPGTDEDDETEVISEYEAEERYRDMLNEVHGVVKIGELEYDASRVLEAVDETAYRVGLADYIDSLAEDGVTVEGYE